MGQNRFKGIECDQCGIPSNKGLQLTMSVRPIYTVKPKGIHEVEDVDFWATFCSKICMEAFLDRFYFNSSLEVMENVE